MHNTDGSRGPAAGSNESIAGENAHLIKRKDGSGPGGHPPHNCTVHWVESHDQLAGLLTSGWETYVHASSALPSRCHAATIPSVLHNSFLSLGHTAYMHMSSAYCPAPSAVSTAAVKLQDSICSLVGISQSLCRWQCHS